MEDFPLGILLCRPSHVLTATPPFCFLWDFLLPEGGIPFLAELTTSGVLSGKNPVGLEICLRYLVPGESGGVTGGVSAGERGGRGGVMDREEALGE